MAGFKYIGRRIFFLKDNGTVILEIGEMKGWVVEPEKEFDKALEEAYKYYTELSKYNKKVVDFIDLEFGEYKTEFAEKTSYKIDVETRKPIFDYTPIPDPPDIPQKVVDFIDLEFGEYKTEFAEKTSYKIDVETRKPIFDYTPIPDPPDIPQTPSLHERMDTQEARNSEQDDLLFEQSYEIAMLKLNTASNSSLE